MADYFVFSEEDLFCPITLWQLPEEESRCSRDCSNSVSHSILMKFCTHIAVAYIYVQ